MATPLDLKLLGTPVVSWKGEVRFLSPPSLLILAYGGSTTRDELVRILWHDGKRVTLRQELSKLRELRGASEWFEADAKGPIVSVIAGSDVARVRHAFNRGDNAYVVERFLGVQGPGILGHLKAGFVPPAFNDWLEQENAHLEHLLAEALHTYVGAQESEGDFRGALASYRRLIRLDPFAEHDEGLRLCLHAAALTAGGL